MLIDDFIRTADIWANDLKKYSFEQLLVKPAPDSWSLGQLYNHIIKSTLYYCKQINICVSTNDYADEETVPGVRKMLEKNAMPDVIIKGPPSNDLTPQPESKEELISGMADIRTKMEVASDLISSSSYKGKTKHAMLQYLSAKEWFQLADIHLRHHLSQKARIEKFLKENGY